MATKSNATDTARRTWDRDEYEAKAKKKDEEERERMKENEERMKKGKKPKKFREELPKATEMMKQREAPLDLDKNQGKTMVVQNPGGRGAGQPGYFCEVCSKNSKDSAAYLSHINSRAHLRRLGQTTKLERSSVQQVRARIAYLREKTKEAASAKAYDFEQRLRDIREKEERGRIEAREKKKLDKQSRLMEVVMESAEPPQEGMEDMMGFVGFGSSKK